MEGALDNVLLGMPEDPEMFLAALATVQDYVTQLKKQVEEKRKAAGWFLAVHIPNPELEFLRPCFPEEVAFVDDWEPRRGDWDLAYKFDPKTAYQLSIPTQQHATTSFGIMIGASPNICPDLSGLNLKRLEAEEADIKFSGFFGYDEELFSILELHRPELKVSGHHPQFTVDSLTRLNSCEVVLGLRSFETYVAAALGKRVLELYPDNRHQGWLSKWSGKYQMVYGSHFPVEIIWRALEGILEKWPMMVKT